MIACDKNRRMGRGVDFDAGQRAASATGEFGH